MEFAKAGLYQIDLKVAVEKGAEGAALRVGEWISPEGPGNSVVVALPAKAGKAGWIKSGVVYVQDKGLRFIFLKAEKLANGRAGSVLAIRVKGASPVVKGEDLGLLRRRLI